MNQSKKTIIIYLINYVFLFQLSAEVRLPAIFSDHMVVQRNQPMKVWGWADKNEKITVLFNNEKVIVTADKNGDWQAVLPELTGGGPYKLIVKAKNTICLNDILIGDVWFCSGQSNMAMSVLKSKNSTEELLDANYPTLRLFSVPEEMSELPQDNFKKGSWQCSNAQTVQDFSAVAFFFGRKLTKDLNVPIGLVKSAWGGTGIKSWISKSGISEFSNYLPALDELKTKNYEQLVKVRDKRQTEWMDTLRNHEPGTKNKWYLPETIDTDWTDIQVPALWQSVGMKGEGVGWYRKEFSLSDEDASNNIVLFLSLIHQKDEAYLNGEKIGETNISDQPRIYPVSSTELRKGKNVLAIKVYNYWSDGGFISNPDDIYIQTKSGKKSLAGTWKFKKGYYSSNPTLVINPNNYPTLLFNTMVNPVVKFPIKGVLWYQGENNTSNARGYALLLSALIKDWRKQWNLGNLPFLIVQLTNTNKPVEMPVKSDWAELREAQASALAIPNTGLAVTIDIGDANDVHAKNKQDVGNRLALAARKIAYNENIVFSGPSYKSFKTEGNKIRIQFDYIGSGLVTNDKYGFVKGFAVAGSDQQFYWAKATIEGNDVIVYSDKVSNPISVRYAWGDNPDASLYNVEKLPAIPFRTDNW